MIYIAFHFRYDKVRICQPYLQYLYEGFHRVSKPILNITSSNIADYRYLHFGSNTPGLVSIMLDLQFFFPITSHYDVYYDEYGGSCFFAARAPLTALFPWVHGRNGRNISYSSPLSRSPNFTSGSELADKKLWCHLLLFRVSCIHICVSPEVLS